MRRRKIYPFLSDQMYVRLKKFVAAAGVTESSVVEAALMEYLDQSSDRKLLLRRLGRVERAQDRHRRDIAVVLETLGAFVFDWMAHTPEVPRGSERLGSQARNPEAFRLPGLRRRPTRRRTSLHRRSGRRAGRRSRGAGARRRGVGCNAAIQYA